MALFTIVWATSQSFQRLLDARRENVQETLFAEQLFISVRQDQATNNITIEQHKVPWFCVRLHISPSSFFVLAIVCPYCYQQVIQFA